MKKKLTDEQKIRQLRYRLKRDRARFAKDMRELRTRCENLRKENAGMTADLEFIRRLGGASPDSIGLIARSMDSLTPESIRDLKRSNAEFMAGYGIQADTKDDDGQVH